MYLKAFCLAVINTRRITADLLVITVMTLSVPAGRPLSGALVAWFISMGLFVSFYVIESTRKKIRALTAKREKPARVVDAAGGVRELPVDQVRENDVVVVPQGEMVPVDGIIIEGASQMDEAMITGEPFTFLRVPGDRVISGAVSTSDRIKVRAAKPGNRSFMYVLAKQVAES